MKALWTAYKRKFKESWVYHLLGLLVVFYFTFSFARAFDEHYHKDHADFSFVFRVGGYLFGASFGLAFIGWLIPLGNWCIKKTKKQYLSEPNVANQSFKYFGWILFWELVAVIILGYTLIGKDFWEAPWEILKELIEGAKSLWEKIK